MSEDMCPHCGESYPSLSFLPSRIRWSIDQAEDGTIDQSGDRTIEQSEEMVVATGLVTCPGCNTILGGVLRDEGGGIQGDQDQRPRCPYCGHTADPSDFFEIMHYMGQDIVQSGTMKCPDCQRVLGGVTYDFDQLGP